MANASNYLGTQIGTKYLNLGAGDSSPASLYVGAFTTVLAADGTGTEVPSSNSYERTEIEASWFTENPVRTFTSNTNIEFQTATGSWGTIVSIGIFDALTGGNLLIFDELDSSEEVTAGSTLTIPTGSLIVTIS